jgi:hypothetical protein
MDIIERLNAFAKTLDTKNAASVAAMASSLTKTAQYVGSQGYWVANSRCWGKCYREKRAKKPEMNAQEVWTECHDEYQKYVEKGDQKWFSYANSKESIKTADTHFISMLKTKVASGVDIGTAVVMSIEDTGKQMNSAFVDASVEMAKIATTLPNEEKANQAAEFSADLLKEAGIFDSLKGLGGEIANKFKGVGQGMATGANIRGLVSSIQRSWDKIEGTVNQLNNDIAQANQYLQGQLKSPNARARTLAQQATGILNQMSKYEINPGVLKQTKTLTTQLNNIVNGLASVSGSPAATPSTPAAAPANATAPATPGNPAAPAAPATPAAATSPAANPEMAKTQLAIDKVPNKQKLLDSLKQMVTEDNNRQNNGDQEPILAGTIYSLKTAAPVAAPSMPTKRPRPTPAAVSPQGTNVRFPSPMQPAQPVTGPTAVSPQGTNINFQQPSQPAAVAPQGTDVSFPKPSRDKMRILNGPRGTDATFAPPAPNAVGPTGQNATFSQPPSQLVSPKGTDLNTQNNGTSVAPTGKNVSFNPAAPVGGIQDILMGIKDEGRRNAVFQAWLKRFGPQLGQTTAHSLYSLVKESSRK